jgi:hypothetical protein
MAGSPRKPVAAGGPCAEPDRAELLGAIRDVQAALAVPASTPDWYGRVSDRLARLRSRFAAHVAATEGPDGWYADLLDAAPRLAGPIHSLIREHGRLTADLDALTNLPAAQLPVHAAGLLHRLSAHRQRGADLLHEAYGTDLGGET